MCPLFSKMENSDNNNQQENKTPSKMSFNTPCEISDTLLMASSEDVCLALKEKISNHDHD